MRILLFLFTLFLATTTHAQQPLEFALVTYSDGTKDQLFDKARNIIIDIYNDPKQVMQSVDRKGGSIIIKAAFDFQQSNAIFGGSDLTKGQIEYTLHLQFKDGRYKYRIKDLYHKAPRSFGYITEGQPPHMKGTHRKWKAKVWQELQQAAKTNSNALATLIQMGMKEKPTNNDW